MTFALIFPFLSDSVKTCRTNGRTEILKTQDRGNVG